MSENARRQLDAFELLMQDHREVESLFRDFDFMRENRKDTGAVIAAACAELKIYDTLETAIFYAAIDEATDDAAIQDLLDTAEDAHDEILEAIEEIELMRTAPLPRDERFAALTALVNRHILREEAELFPLVRELPRLDLEAVANAMKKRRAELGREAGSTEAYREVV